MSKYFCTYFVFDLPRNQAENQPPCDEIKTNLPVMK